MTLTDTNEIASLSSRLAQAQAVINDDSYNENKAELSSQALLYSAYISDLDSGAIAVDENTSDMLKIAAEFCDLIESR